MRVAGPSLRTRASRPRALGGRSRSARAGCPRRSEAPAGTRTHEARLGSARLGSARLGSARLGSARLGSARLGSARLGSAPNYIVALQQGLRRHGSGAPSARRTDAPHRGLGQGARRRAGKRGRPGGVNDGVTARSPASRAAPAAAVAASLVVAASPRSTLGVSPLSSAASSGTGTRAAWVVLPGADKGTSPGSPQSSPAEPRRCVVVHSPADERTISSTGSPAGRARPWSRIGAIPRIRLVAFRVSDNANVSDVTSNVLVHYTYI